MRRNGQKNFLSAPKILDQAFWGVVGGPIPIRFQKNHHPAV